MNNTLVTGANGLVGRALCTALERTGHKVVRAVRTSASPGSIAVGELNAGTDWTEALSGGIDTVVHLAAQLPSTDGANRQQDDRYAEVNTLGTAGLARQCAQHGVKRFVFVSTIKVLGEGRDAPYRSDDLALPDDAYARSKWEAEQALWQIAAETGMELVVLRPPLVYGPGVKGNFLRLMQAIDKHRPLPLGAIRNRRSLLYLGNLVDAICLCLKHTQAAGKTFLISDDDDVSTPELIRRIAAALGCRPRLIPLPVAWMQWAGGLLGKQAAIDRLLGSLSADIMPLRNALAWHPPYTMQAGLEATAQWYRENRGGPGRLAMLRILDIVLAGVGLLLTLPVMALLFLAGLFDTGAPLFRQERVGRHRQPFTLVKFRTMRPDTRSVATHLANPAAVTRLGAFLRRTKLDELPQLWNVLKGEMSLVGPRPCLFNQHELIEERAARDVFAARPGITGLAQISGIDMSTPRLLAETDARMLQTLDMAAYFAYVIKTVTGAGQGDRVRHD